MMRKCDYFQSLVSLLACANLSRFANVFSNNNSERKLDVKRAKRRETKVGFSLLGDFNGRSTHQKRGKRFFIRAREHSMSNPTEEL